MNLMDKIIKNKILTVIIIVIGFLFGCEEEDAELVKITIKNPPVKTNYFEGEKLSLEGLIITLKNSDGASKDILFDDFNTENIKTYPVDGSELSHFIENIQIEHQPTDKAVDQPIVVKKIVVSGIEVKSEPEKIEYIEGETLDLTGFEVSLIKNNGDIKNVGIDDFGDNDIEISVNIDSMLSSDITKIEVTHSISGSKMEQAIIVKDVVALALKTNPTKKEYYKWEELDISDLEVVIYIENTSNQLILGIDDFSNFGITTSILHGEILSEFTSGLINIDIKHEISENSTFISINFNEFLIDVDNNEYEIVRIENRIWMAENLKVTRYSDGTPITLVESDTDWYNLEDNNTDKAYCYYNNNINNEAEIYGAMYTFAAAVNGSPDQTGEDTIQGVCPDGWHVATYDDWRSIGGGTTLGSIKLKAEGDEYWGEGNNGTDVYGFRALPGGYRNSIGEFEGINEEVHWWETTEAGNNRDARGFFMDKGDYFRSWSATMKSNGFYVRCVKN